VVQSVPVDGSASRGGFDDDRTVPEGSGPEEAAAAWRSDAAATARRREQLVRDRLVETVEVAQVLAGAVGRMVRIGTGSDMTWAGELEAADREVLVLRADTATHWVRPDALEWVRVEGPERLAAPAAGTWAAVVEELAANGVTVRCTTTSGTVFEGRVSPAADGLRVEDPAGRMTYVSAGAVAVLSRRS